MSTVEHPAHYMVGNAEVKDIINEVTGDTGYIYYCLGNIIKYVCRYDKKGTPVEDLKKARMYCTFILDTLNSGNSSVQYIGSNLWYENATGDWRNTFFLFLEAPILLATQFMASMLDTQIEIES